MIEVRNMMAGDAPELVAILNDIIETGGTTAYLTPRSVESFIAENLMAKSLVSSITAHSGGRAVGFQVLKTTAENGVGSIASFADQRNIIRGVGRAMMQQTLANARAEGMSAINAVIRADNVPGLAFYGKCGFQDHSVIKDMPLTDGTIIDRIVKRLIL